MKVEIAWKSIDNRQTKTFRDEMDCIAWIRSHSKDIVCINDTFTGGNALSHFEIADAIRGNNVRGCASSVDIANALGFGIPKG